MSAPAKPEIASVSWVDGYGREYQLVPKAKLDAADATADRLAADCDRLSAELDRWKASATVASETIVQMQGAINATRDSRDRFKAERDAYTTAITEAGLGIDADSGRLTDSTTGAELSGNPGQLPQPEATNPGHLRFAATIIEQTAVPKDHGGDGEDQERTARQLRDEADRIEGKRPSPDEQLVAGVAEICESTVRNLFTTLGVTHVSNVDPSVVDWRSAAEEALSAAGLLRDGDA